MRWKIDGLLPEIEKRAAGSGRFVIAVDGRCGAGKTTLAARLQEALSCQVVHMDEFFLRPEQRTAQRLSQPGGNVDYERFLGEVLLPLRRGEAFSYRPYDCASQSLGAPVAMEAGGVTIVEGSYSCHPALRQYYDLRIFLTVGREEQLRRIENRCPEKLPAFREKWIPLEEAYFSQCGVEAACDGTVSTEE